MKKLTVIFLLAVLQIITTGIYAYDVEVKGKGTIGCKSCEKLNDKERKTLLQTAKQEAWKSYVSSFDQSRMKSYNKIEKEFIENLDKYIIELTVIGTTYQADLKQCELLVRAKINSTAVDLKLNENSAIGKVESGEGGVISCIFVARQLTSTKAFKDKVTDTKTSKEDLSTKQDIKLQEQGKGELSTGDTTQKKSNTVTDESIESTASKVEYDAKISADVNASSQQVLTETTVTGGSIEKKAIKETYEAKSATDFNAAFNEVLTQNGYEITEYDDVYAECKGASMKTIRSEFGANDELSTEVRKMAIDAARNCGVRYLVIGFMNVSATEKDPVTGNYIVFVSVNGMVWDIAKKLPKKIGSVGPVQYSGLGPDQNTARRIALKLAATESAKAIVNQLSAKDIK